ncbi:hypothetical protein HWV62_13052 [Athelia sp. TMB]|nr:hypothetical protein HWV62_13052 [Athelia sp. TMB]
MASEDSISYPLPPPSYPANKDGAQLYSSPPAYTFPQLFKIGRKQTSGPLVTTAALHSHLGLLRQFWNLCQAVESGQDARIPVFALAPEPELRWAWFVTLAVDRFERWVKGMRYNYAVDSSLPPIDVAMVWHAYLLNPGYVAEMSAELWYSEDTSRLSVLGSLMTQNGTLLKAMENDTYNAPPSQSRVDAWMKATSSPFDPFDSAAVTRNRTFACPRCRRDVEAPFITASGRGYAQQNFCTNCPSCSSTITKGGLGMLKFAQDIASPGRELAGTLYTPTDSKDRPRAARIKNAILQGTAFNGRRTCNTDLDSKTLEGREYENLIFNNCEGSLVKLRELVGKQMKGGGGRLLSRIMGAYTNDSIFSIDLVGAVLRQGSFIKKMQHLRWTEQGFFDGPDDEVVLQHCVARYHAFLDLIASSPGPFFVPTLDIDLAWHTHQLLARRYLNDTMSYVGRFVDHTSFDLTCRAWQSRFNVAYMHCGCPLPGDTLGQKLAAKVKRRSQQQQSFLLPPDHPDSIGATHPSDHNSVFAFHHSAKSDAARRKRAAKAERRRARDTANMEKGKLAREAHARGWGHQQAFLEPVPYYYGPGFGGCLAWYGGVDAGGVPLGREGVQLVEAFVGAAPGAGLWDVEEEEASAGVEAEEAAAGAVEADVAGVDAWVDDIQHLVSVCFLLGFLY